jgi:hypothetical protein
MKITYQDVADTIAVMDEIRSLKLPIRVSLRIAQGLRKAREAFQDFDMVRQDIINEYGIRQINSDMSEEEQKEIMEHNQSILPLANNKIREALEHEIEIEFKPIKKIDFKDEEFANLQEVDVRIMEATWWMWEF